MRNHLQKAHDRWAPGFGGVEKTGFKRETAATLSTDTDGIASLA